MTIARRRGSEPDVAAWNDWRWQLLHRIASGSALVGYLTGVKLDLPSIELSRSRFRMAITPYYASLIDPDDPSCPIMRQCVPSAAELEISPLSSADPLAEEQQSPVPGVVHRYPDRALIILTSRCAVYCRHCTRRRLVGREEPRSPERLLTALRYVQEHTEIKDVIISGGDPLLCSDRFLDRFLTRLRAIDHIEIVRIGTRVPVVLPQRITPDLCDMLRRHHPLYVNTQFNHPGEITPDSERACAMLSDAGMPVGNQTVLLRGVNDSKDTMTRLLRGLVRNRVRPYYLYQCDLGQGMDHFRTPVQTGIDIMNHLRGRVSGLAIPSFVIDAPGGKGKIPLLPDYVISRTGGLTVLRNSKGEISYYPDPASMD